MKCMLRSLRRGPAFIAAALLPFALPVQEVKQDAPVTGQAVRQVEVTDRPMGTATFRLLDAMAYNPESHKGHKMYVRGLLIRLPGKQRMTISSFETIAPGCAN